MTRDEAYQEALEEADRNPDGSVDEKSLIDILARKLDIDEDSIRYKEAKRLINKKSRPGQTQCEGQLSLLGETPYAYEPERLVRFGDGKVVENRRSRPVAKQAEAERAQKNVQRVMNWAQRKQKESNQFSQWAIDELQHGRPANEITWDNCVHETGMWGSEEAPPEDEPPEDTI